MRRLLESMFSLSLARCIGIFDWQKGGRCRAVGHLGVARGRVFLERPPISCISLCLHTPS
jgi:hypothetical protein